MGRHDRSRSPGRSGRPNSAWISRTICSFGRYPDKRPAGLQVDATGEFCLHNLMSVWGWAQGLTDDMVLEAVHNNMFHDNDSKAMRFGINNSAKGDVLVRVMPSRRGAGAHHGGSWGGRHNNGYSNGHSNAYGNAYQQQYAVRSPCPTPAHVQVVPMHGSVLKAPGIALPSVSQKLGMSLEEIAATDSRITPVAWRPEMAPRMVPPPGVPVGPKQTEDKEPSYAPRGPPEAHESPAYAARVHRQMEQMGLTQGTAHIRQPPTWQAPRDMDRNGSTLYGPRRRQGGHGCGAGSTGAWGASGGAAAAAVNRSTGERISRSLSWMLRQGSAMNAEGWMDLDSLAATMAQTHASYGVFDGAQLRTILEQTDEAGRFEFNTSGCVRKVRRTNRRPRPNARVDSWVPPVNGAASSSGHAAAPAAEGGAGRGRSRSMSVDAACGTGDADEGGGAPRATDVPAREAPRRPPGEFWTKYQDDGSEWWHYDGPLGQWWLMTTKFADPVPYGESDDGE
eukprot:NODE_2728_length_2157_cov_4.667488.p1 GENE.NODE_2728_length_2157_cov_4.667488~~NODE_2728_length_2157_cov_4.667488.p1  ORF type:complete len:507 (+),score=99.29 NODE_2728_length_2157_cov_4.667488:247-1767(+)